MRILDYDIALQQQQAIIHEKEVRSMTQTGKSKRREMKHPVYMRDWPNCTKPNCKGCIERFGLDRKVLWFCPEGKKMKDVVGEIQK